MDDEEAVAELLGRDPGGDFTVVVRAADGAPVVIENQPFLRDGTPMPTRYWLTDAVLREAVSRLESSGGVRAAELAVDSGRLADAHLRYADERDGFTDLQCALGTGKDKTFALRSAGTEIDA